MNALIPPPVFKRTIKRIDVEALKDLLAQNLTDDEIVGSLRCSLASVHRYRRILCPDRPKGPKRDGPRGEGGKTRFASQPLKGKCAIMPPVDNAALAEARTLYPSMRRDAGDVLHLLVSGVNHWKIGAIVTKSAWRDFPIYTLTLEERATCPPSCVHWRSCYGNHMHRALRIRHDADFEARLISEVQHLAWQHRHGFAVRLHVLGDFYSVDYVRLWRDLVETHPNLHLFGFTARIDGDDPITKALVDFVTAHWPRAAIRFSNAPVLMASTVSIEHPLQKPDDAILCPQQTGRTDNCGTCGLCWTTLRRIAFLRH